MGFTPRRLIAALGLVLGGFLIVATVHGQSPAALGGSGNGAGPSAVPDGRNFPNPEGTSSTISTTGSTDLTGPFFQSLGTNGRTCGTCHQPGDGMTVSAAHVQDRFEKSGGLDPIFRSNDGSNCNHDPGVTTIDLSTVAKRKAAYSLLRTRGLIRVAIDVPAGGDFYVDSVSNPYGCEETTTISQYRRPLPSTNLRFLSAVMWDGRESAGANKILYANYSTQLIKNLLQQSLDATNGHAQGVGLNPTDTEKHQIVDFEMGSFTAQASNKGGGLLNAQGAAGGPKPLINAPYFISFNSSVDALQYSLGAPPSAFVESPGGLVTPGDLGFTMDIFNIFDAWSGLPQNDPHAAVARGQALFNNTRFSITGVKGINDDFGLPSVTGGCGTCHDTPNVGNHSFPTPLDIGTGDPMSLGNPGVNQGGLDISYLPQIRACRNSNHLDCVTTTDLGQALITGKFNHIGKLKGPILRGLSARAPYFHNGSAQSLLDVVKFYETRFGFLLTPQQESDLVAFLSAI